MKNFNLALFFAALLGWNAPALADQRCGEGPERLKAIGATVETKENSYGASMPSAGRITISCSVSGVLILASSESPTPPEGFYSDLAAVAGVFHHGGSVRHLLQACYRQASSAAAAGESDNRQGALGVHCSFMPGQGGYVQYAVTIDR